MYVFQQKGRRRATATKSLKTRGSARPDSATTDSIRKNTELMDDWKPLKTKLLQEESTYTYIFCKRHIYIYADPHS